MERRRSPGKAAVKPVIFVLGGPGSGKGTQCAKIAEKYGFRHISTGDLMRREIKFHSERGKRLMAIPVGDLAPLEEILGLLKDEMENKPETCKGFLIDGYPREVEQAIRFESDVCKCSFVIYFDVKDETLVARIQNRGKTSAREDDQKEEIIRKRLQVFHRNLKPILDHYKGKVERIPADRTVDEIFDDVCKCIDRRCKGLEIQ